MKQGQILGVALALLIIKGSSVCVASNYQVFDEEKGKYESFKKNETKENSQWQENLKNDWKNETKKIVKNQKENEENEDDNQEGIFESIWSGLDYVWWSVSNKNENPSTKDGEVIEVISRAFNQVVRNVGGMSAPSTLYKVLGKTKSENKE